MDYILTHRKNLIIGQSGGPTAVINNSLYGIIKEARLHKDKIESILGMVNGVEGLLQDKVINLDKLDSHSLELLKTTPGAYLGSCRYKLPEGLEEPVYKNLFNKLEELNIGYFLYIGGNDSMDTVSKLSAYAEKYNIDVCFIGQPKTIDNDLVMTDHTPGFGSAARYVASTVREISIDASVYNTKAVTIVEIMGRHAGWLTAASVLARKYEGDNPVLIYLPESPFSQERFIDQVKTALMVRNDVIVCVSEGIKDNSGVFICEYGSEAGLDSFGHKMLAGCGKYLENLVRSTLNVKARSVELNVCQRCSSLLLSETDASEARDSGAFGVKAALEGYTGKMVSFIRTGNSPYGLKFGLEDVSVICNREKTVPEGWIIKNGSDIGSDFITYASSLIQGAAMVPMGGDGLPEYAYRK